MAWCFDTSALLEPWNRHYPPVVASQLWEIIDEMWESGEIIVPDEVFHETKRFDDEVHRWVAERKKRLREPTEDVQEEVRNIMKSHPKLVGQGKGRSGGDPWMIATAAVDDATVVTYEGSDDKSTKVKIPSVCEDIGVACAQFREFLTGAKITLGATRS